MVFHDNIQFETCFLFHKKKKGNNLYMLNIFPIRQLYLPDIYFRVLVLHTQAKQSSNQEAILYTVVILKEFQRYFSRQSFFYQFIYIFN